VLHLGTPAWQIAVRTFVVYAGVFVGFRILGKREIGQITIFDLVLILLIANAVQNAMVGPDTSLLGGLIAAAVLLAVNQAVARVRILSPRVDRLFEGQPSVLVEHGKPMLGQLRRQGLAEEDLNMAMREHGIDRLSDVELAVLETDGSISIVPTSSRTYRSKRRVRAIRKH
jgi:uncharacterized membrane protein YcaP (DUF421 family)